MTKNIALILAAAVAACGSKPPAPPSPPAPASSTITSANDQPDHEHNDGASATAAPEDDHADHDHSAGASAAPVPASDHAEHEGAMGHAPTAQPAAPPTASTKSDAGGAKTAMLAAERSAWDAARPVFDKACASCHTAAGKKAAKKKLDHFNMDTYPLGGHHTQTIGFTIRDVLGISGKKPTMPFDKPGSVQGDDLAKIKAWTDAWQAAEKGGAHPVAGGSKHDD